MRTLIMGLLATVLSACGVSSYAYPDKLGWLDDSDFTASDRQRVAEIAGTGVDSNEGVIRGIQAGFRGSVTRRDFELLRQDRRRARAAYPDVSCDDLTQGVWLSVDMDARIPDSWCSSGNSNGTQGSDGKWYLDGGCYMGVVKPQYTKRATAADTKAFFVALKAKERAEKVARLKADGPFALWGGTGGSMSVSLDKATNEVVVKRADEWASTATEWRIPYVPEEWADIYAGDLDAVKALPSFARATSKQVTVTPSGTSISMASGTTMGSQGMTIPPGGTVTMGVQIH
jgi:hypothetical protein